VGSIVLGSDVVDALNEATERAALLQQELVLLQERRAEVDNLIVQRTQESLRVRGRLEALQALVRS